MIVRRTNNLLIVVIALLLSPLPAVNTFAALGSKGNNWVVRHPFFSTENHFRSIVYGNSPYLAAGISLGVAGDDGSYLFPMDRDFTLTYSTADDKFVLEGNSTLTFEREPR